MVMRVLIADADRKARARLRALLEEEGDVEIAGECAEGRQAALAVEELRPDLVFLEVRFPDMDGFEVIRSVGLERFPPFVFMSSEEGPAARAFEVRAVDFLVKPFDGGRLRESAGRARTVLRRESLEELSDRIAGAVAQMRFDKRYARRLLIRAAGRVTLVDVEEIDWVEADAKRVRVHAGGRTHVLREMIGQLEARLDPAKFLRVHRSAIVNLDRVARIETSARGGQEVVLEDGTRLPLSRASRIKIYDVAGGEEE